VVACTDGFDTPVSYNKRLTHFMEMLPIALEYYMSLLSEHVQFSVASSLTRNFMLGIYQSVY
jgi:hypothetical protein